MSDWLSPEQGALLLTLVVAAEAGGQDEVPVGAVVCDALGRILSAQGNDCVTRSDPVGHAEMRALGQAARRLRNYRLLGTRLFISLEACPLCREAVGLSRVSQMACAARRDPESAAQPESGFFQDQSLESASVALLHFFFARKRADLKCDGKSVLIP